MRIAQIAPLTERVPPKKYGGTERVIHALTEELVRRGHEVTLFASGDSQTRARLVSVYPRALREARIKNLYSLNSLTLLNIGQAYMRHRAFDIIHDHNEVIGLPTANIIATPTVITTHGLITPQHRAIYQKLNRPFLVTISQAQARHAPGLNYIGNVYNGLAMEDYPLGLKPDDYLLFVGRISMEKGVHYAIEVAMHLNRPLLIAAKLDPTDHAYFNEYISPYLSDSIQWIGEVDELERNRLMSKAWCFLHPVTWREPFGLTMIEAMACGCPVIAFARGSVPEIVQHGKTGFVVEQIEEMMEAVETIPQIDRQYCREYALRNFNAQRMTDGYEVIYQKILREAR